MKAAFHKVLKGLWVLFILVALTGLWACDEGDEGDECEPLAFYGPQPCANNDECVQIYGVGWYCDTANAFDDGCGNQVTWPMCREENCEPAAFYGPPPCQDNTDCEDMYGAGWYCDTANTFQDGCGGEVTWPVCREQDCEPAAFYGPQPCESNEQCIQDYGAGWYCDTENTYDDDCGNQYTWPVCKEEPQ